MNSPIKSPVPNYLDREGKNIRMPENVRQHSCDDVAEIESRVGFATSLKSDKGEWRKVCQMSGFELVRSLGTQNSGLQYSVYWAPDVPDITVLQWHPNQAATAVIDETRDRVGTLDVACGNHD
ncbi:MAG: hypothetical protein ABL890_04200 [Candidatus Peribacteraceae bacterium]